MLSSPVSARHAQASPVKGLEDDKGTRVTYIQEKAELELLSLEKTQGDFISMYK